jgi:CheY-like chemotaxis protein
MEEHRQVLLIVEDHEPTRRVLAALLRRRGWDVDVVPLPPELHNRPERIAPAVAAAAAGAGCDIGGARAIRIARTAM